MIKLVSTVDGKEFPLTIRDIVHVPSAPHNLISISHVTDTKYDVLFSGNNIRFKSPSGTITAKGKKEGRLYNMDIRPFRTADKAYLTKEARTWEQWHKILGHISMDSIKLMKRNGLVEGMEIDGSKEPAAQCNMCIQAKQHVTPFPKESITKVTEIGDLTLTDVWGPARTQAVGRERYFASFTNASTRHSIIYFMKKKSETLTKLKYYRSLIKTQTGRDLKRVRADGGGEFVGGESRKYLQEEGIELETMATYSPSQNGIVERLNRTLVEHARAMIIKHDLPYSLWKEAVAYANYLRK